MPMPRSITRHPAFSDGRRIAALALASLGCALACALLAVLAFQFTLPETDAAHGENLLANSLVLTTAGACVVIGAPLGFLAALFLLRNARLAPSIIVVATVALVTAAIAGRLSLLSAPLVLLASLFAMFWCQERFSVPQARRPATRS